ncbi:MAG: hypothetical protein L6R37_006524 [Teloschistes peruensis]|nr:MAG: hypothetical protein L6R37_006524 [Teloschistes peruensis]
MDHLPRLTNVNYPSLPFLGDDPYDGLPFTSYPQRCGWDPDRLQNGDFSQHAAGETAEFLQSWLYLGTVNEILGIVESIQTYQYVRLVEPESLYISTGALNGHIKEWAAFLNDVDQDRRSQEIHKAQSCLTTVYRVCQAISGCANPPCSADFSLSVQILGRTIDQALKWFWDIPLTRDWGLKDIATFSMLQSGWCLRDVSLARASLSDMSMLVVSRMQRSLLEQQDHFDCSERLCLVNQVDEKAYQTRHTTTLCRCQHIVLDQNRVRQILQAGEIPVVSLTVVEDGIGPRQVEAEVKGFSSYRWFFAISHVWSDGLGNPYQNSLPHCQLLALYDLLANAHVDEQFDTFNRSLDMAFDRGKQAMGPDQVDEMALKVWDGIHGFVKKTAAGGRRVVDGVRKIRKKPINIWIDTLCVPLDKEVRKAAIAGLKKVYSGSLLTVVLDSELQLLSKEMPPEELLMHMCFSGWMRRAWTYQEAVLSNRKLRVRLSDGLVNLSDLLGFGTLDPRTLITSPQVGVDWNLHQNKLTQLLKWHMARGETKAKIAKVRAEIQSELEAEAVEEKKNFSLKKILLRDAIGSFDDMSSLFFVPRDTKDLELNAGRIASAWNSLVWRATSKQEDRLSIFLLACATDESSLREVLPLFDLGRSIRMAHWVLQQRSLPLGILFTRGPRLLDPELGWAPLTVFDDRISNTTCIPRSPGERTLTVVLPGLVLNVAEQRIFRHFVVAIEDLARDYRVVCDADYPPSWVENGWSVKFGMLGLILQECPKDGEQQVGILVAVKHQNMDMISGIYQCRVEIQDVTNTSTDTTVPALYTPSPITWCIS